MVLFAPAAADPYKEGRELYKAGRYREAAVKLEQAVHAEPENAKAWWQLCFAYNKLQRYADALRAAERAEGIDPTHSFASSPAKYQETVARLRKKVGGRPGSPGAVAPSRELGPLSGPDGTLSQQLQKRGVFVQHGMNVDVDRLVRVIKELEPVQVRFLVFGSTAGSAALSREADRVRRYLGIRNGFVIACSRGGVAASSEQLNQATLRELTRQAAVRMEAGDYTGALEDLARGRVATHAKQAATRKTATLSILGTVVALAVGWVILRRITRARSVRARRAVLEARKSEIDAQMNYLDDARGALPEAVAERVRQARLEAGTKLDEASRIMAKSRDEYELSRALDLLEDAQRIANEGRAVLDAALAGKPIPPPAGPTGVPPLYPGYRRSDHQTNWEEVPESQRGVCFFCSKPAFLDELKPVTIELEGTRQRVLACEEDYRSIRGGQPPRIRAFERQGRYIPWYADPEYDPYRDYYDRYGLGDAFRDLVLLNMIDRMFWDWDRPGRGWGWGGGYGSDWDGYTFWPEHHHYRDYYSERAASGSDFQDDLGRHAAGTDFLDSGGGYGESDDAAGTDFLDRDES